MSAKLSDRARNDLAQIYSYIYASRGAKVAEQFLLLARQAVAFIRQQPYAGPHPNWATRHQDLRFWMISGTRFIIYYIPQQNEVRIERVLDGRRDVQRILDHGMEEPPTSADED